MSDLYTSMGNVETNKIEKPQNNTSISLLDDNNTSYQEVETEMMDLSTSQEQLIDTEQYDIYIKDLENTKKELEAELQAENNEITPDEVSINQQISTYKANLTTLVVRYTQSEDLTKRDLGMSREEFIKLSPEEQESLVATKTEEGKSYKQNIETLESQLEKSNTKNENISQLEGNIALLNTAINSLKQQKEALPYQQMLTTEEYQNYESKSEVSNDISKYATNYDIRTNIDYERYCEDNGNISPLELLKGLKEQNPTIPLPQSMTGVENIGELKQLLELEEVNPEMVKLYNYIYDTEGKDAANEYLDIIKPQLNQMQGQKQAQEYLNSLEKDENGNYNQADVLNHLKTSGKGLGDGVENFFQGFANLFNSTGELSVNDYETIYIMQALEENGGLLSNNYELSQSIGNVAPSIIISMLATPMVGTVAGVSAAGTIGSTIGTVSMGLSSGGNAYAGALSQGYSTPQAIMYGVLTGSTEAVTQKLLGGLPGLNDVAITGVKTYLQASAREGFQEGVQSVMDSYFRSVLFGEEIDLDQLIDEVGTSAVYGAITAGIFNSPNLTLNYTNKSIQKLKGVDGFDKTALGTGLGLTAVEIDNLVNNNDTTTKITVPEGKFNSPGIESSSKSDPIAEAKAKLLSEQDTPSIENTEIKQADSISEEELAARRKKIFQNIFGGKSVDEGLEPLNVQIENSTLYQYTYVDTAHVIRNPDEYIMPPCQKACKTLWDKNIETFMVSNLEDKGNIYVQLGKLSPENKQIFEQLMQKDNRYRYNKYRETYEVRVPGTTMEAGEVLAELMTPLKAQDVMPNRYQTATEFLEKTNKNYSSLTLEEALEQAGKQDCYDEASGLVFDDPIYKEWYIRYRYPEATQFSTKYKFQYNTNSRFSTSEQVANPDKYFIQECIPTCQELWNKNIEISKSSKKGDRNLYVALYNLSDENKQIFEQLMQEHPENYIFDTKMDAHIITVPGTTEADSNALLKLTEPFQVQDVGNTHYTLKEEFLKTANSTGERKVEINPDGTIHVSGTESLGMTLKEALVAAGVEDLYDPITGRIFKNPLYMEWNKRYLNRDQSSAGKVTNKVIETYYPQILSELSTSAQNEQARTFFENVQYSSLNEKYRTGEIPIHYEYIPDITTDAIYLDAPAVETLNKAIELTKQTEEYKETSYALFGIRMGDNIIIADGVVGIPEQARKTEYDSILNAIQNKLGSNQQINVVVMGHTHPSKDPQNRTFSLQDLGGYLYNSDTNENVSKGFKYWAGGRDIELMGEVTIVEDGQPTDFNFVSMSDKKLGKYRNVYDIDGGDEYSNYSISSFPNDSETYKKYYMEDVNDDIKISGNSE